MVLVPYKLCTLKFWKLDLEDDAIVEVVVQEHVNEYNN